MEEDSKDLFGSKLLSEAEAQLIIESMEGLTDLGMKEPRSWVRDLYLDYFQKLRDLVIELYDTGTIKDDLMIAKNIVNHLIKYKDKPHDS